MTDYTNINWDPFFSAYENDTVVKAIVGEVSGNGHQVFVMGVPAYLPKTQKVPDMELTTGGDVDVCIIKIMPETNNVVVSARVAAEKKAGDGAEKLEVGQVVTARTRSATLPTLFPSETRFPSRSSVSPWTTRGNGKSSSATSRRFPTLGRPFPSRRGTRWKES